MLVTVMPFAEEMTGKCSGGAERPAGHAYVRGGVAKGRSVEIQQRESGIS